MTKGPLKMQLVAHLKVNHLAMLGLILLTVLTSGCPSEGDVRAAAWLNMVMPQELCDSICKTAPQYCTINGTPKLKYGAYRKLTDTKDSKNKYEFVSFCNPAIKHWISFNDVDLKNLMDATIQQ